MSEPTETRLTYDQASEIFQSGGDLERVDPDIIDGAIVSPVGNCISFSTGDTHYYRKAIGPLKHEHLEIPRDEAATPTKIAIELEAAFRRIIELERVVELLEDRIERIPSWGPEQ